eukprot:g29934.t1
MRSYVRRNSNEITAQLDCFSGLLRPARSRKQKFDYGLTGFAHSKILQIKSQVALLVEKGILPWSPAEQSTWDLFALYITRAVIATETYTNIC